MLKDGKIKPDFLLIGAQKSGTTWIWNMLKQHPDADLPKKKEIHFFGGVENYRLGVDWYYRHFQGLDSSRVIGEASTTYLYDYLPYWENASGELIHDPSLPSIPELVIKELPDIKILAILRDPVSRAVSAYRHHVRAGRVPIGFGLKDAALKVPMLRVLEMGYYARYLELWKKCIPADRMHVVIFEEDVLRSPERTFQDICKFLGIRSNFHPQNFGGKANEGWSWTRCMICQHENSLIRLLGKSQLGKIFDRHDFLKGTQIVKDDRAFFRSIYMKEKENLERLLGRSLSCWNYGSR